MKRTIFKNHSHYSYNEQNEPIILSKALIDSLLKLDNPTDYIGLYAFYYYTAKWQRTNKPKATN